MKKNIGKIYAALFLIVILAGTAGAQTPGAPVQGNYGTPSTSVGAAGSAVPANASANGINVGGNLQVQTGTQPLNGTYAAHTDFASVGGTPISLYVNLLNTVLATGSQTSSAVRLPGLSSAGTLWVTGASITGSPSGCQIVLTQQSNLGSPASTTIATIAITPANSYQSFNVAPAQASVGGDTIIAAYTCGTTYPTTGTISVGFDPMNVARSYLLGNTGAIVDAAPGANIPANVLMFGGKTQGSGSNAGTTTGGNAANVLTDLSGQLFVIPGGSFRVSAFISMTTATTTQIVAAPGAGIFAFITGVVINTRVAGTGSTIQLVTGTGSNCGTGQAPLTPAFSNAAIGVVSLQFNTPLVPPSASAICVTQTATAGTTDILLTGYVSK